MRILLIDPPYDCLQNIKTTRNYPLGLAYIASYLNENKHEAIYLNMDCDLNLPAANPFSRKDVMHRYGIYLEETSSKSEHPVWSNFVEAIKYFRPDIIGISANSVKIKSVFRLVEITKQINPQIVTVLGGFHTQIFAREILENIKEIDFIILDEGEKTLLELADELDKKNEARFDSMKGLVFRNRDHHIVFNERRPLIDELDNFPRPSHCYWYEQEKFIKQPILALMASRGCPFDCNYCATNQLWQKKVRFKSPRSFVDEIKASTLDQREIFLSFYDDCFTLNKKWLLEFCDIMVKESIKVNWQCITSVNLLEEAIFKKIIKAGCRKINIGIESGSERILKEANKNIKLNDVKRIFNLAKKYGISTAAYIMIGFPSETEYDIRLTQKIIQETRPGWVYCNVLIPLPGTKYYERLIDQKLIDPTNAWRGDTIKNIIVNYTNTMTDEKFFNLVDETFEICYKINSNIANLIRRAPIRQYFINPISFFIDIKRAVRYIKRKNRS